MKFIMKIILTLVVVFLLGIFFPPLWLVIPFIIIGPLFYSLIKWWNEQDKKRKSAEGGERKNVVKNMSKVKKFALTITKIFLSLIILGGSLLIIVGLSSSGGDFGEGSYKRKTSLPKELKQKTQKPEEKQKVKEVKEKEKKSTEQKESPKPSVAQEKQKYAVLSGIDNDPNSDAYGEIVVQKINVWEKAEGFSMAIGDIPHNTKVEVLESKEIEGNTFYKIRSSIGKVSVLPTDFNLRKKKMEELPKSEWSVPADETFPVEGWVIESFVTKLE